MFDLFSTTGRPVCFESFRRSAFEYLLYVSSISSKHALKLTLQHLSDAEPELDFEVGEDEFESSPAGPLADQCPAWQHGIPVHELPLARTLLVEMAYSNESIVHAAWTYFAALHGAIGCLGCRWRLLCAGFSCLVIAWLSGSRMTWITGTSVSSSDLFLATGISSF